MNVDPFADDLATLGLDLIVAKAGWARHAPNPLLLVASDGPASCQPVSAASGDEIYLAEPYH
jgi:Protein involved in formate dehydrogenase formation